MKIFGVSQSINQSIDTALQGHSVSQSINQWTEIFRVNPSVNQSTRRSLSHSTTRPVCPAMTALHRCCFALFVSWAAHRLNAGPRVSLGRICFKGPPYQRRVSALHVALQDFFSPVATRAKLLTRTKACKKNDALGMHRDVHSAEACLGKVNAWTC